MTEDDVLPPTAASLYCGAGGDALGLKQVGFDVQVAVDVDGPALDTVDVQLHGTAAKRHDLADVDPTIIPKSAGGKGDWTPGEMYYQRPDERDELGVLFIGPPCQGVSQAGGKIDPYDPRNEHIIAAPEWVAALEPQVVIIENVDALVRDHGQLHTIVTGRLEDLGYTHETIRLDSADYGVPQHRERAFIVGVRDDRPTPDQWAPPVWCAEDAPDRENGQRNIQGYKTASDAIGDLPAAMEPHSPVTDDVHCGFKYAPDGSRMVSPQPCGREIEIDGETVWMPPNHIAHDHTVSHRKKIADYELGHSGSSVTRRRLHPDKPAPTITSSNATPPVNYQGQSPAHPDRPLEDVRRLTVRECARLQTFPDHYCFPGLKEDRFRLVGNAVPPLLAAHLGSHFGNTSTKFESRAEVEGRKEVAVA